MEIPVTLKSCHQNFLGEIIQQGKDYALSNGIMLRSADGETNYHAPITLFPSPVPRHCFETAIQVQTVFNSLMHKVAHDHEFLLSCLEKTIEVDEFTNKLWEIYLKVKQEGFTQPISLGLNRSDYMISGDENTKLSGATLKQVEFNTMASGAGSLSQRLCQWHKYILGVANKPEAISKIADNNASDGLAAAMVNAWSIYNRPQSVILFLVLKTETNIYDQRLLEYSINQNNVRCRVIRRTLQDIQERAELGVQKQLVIDGFEVAVVYQRSCYNPGHFRGEQDWAARLKIERSLAIKCPSIHYHLAGTKKVQQILAAPGVLKRFINDEQERKLVESTQVGLFSLDLNEAGDRNVEMAIQDPCRFVMKPQREGGGNNIFGEEIATTLKALKQSKERTAYILMERIRPLQFQNYILKHGHDVTLQLLISEIGIFGSFIGSADTVHHNAVHGYLFRTKTIDTDEGGLMSGTAALDSIYLVE